jgi:hypothetical protein
MAFTEFRRQCAPPSPPETQAILCRRRHQARRPPLAKIRPGRPAPAMGPGTAAAALDQPSQRYQHCRQSQNYHCDKYHRVGWHVCQKIDHLALPPAVPNAKRRTPQLRARSNESAKTAMLRSARFRFVIFIKKNRNYSDFRPIEAHTVFIFYPSGERRIIAVAFHSRRIIRSFSRRCIRAVLCERTAEASARITCDR